MRKVFLILISIFMLQGALQVQAQTTVQADDLLCKHCQEIATARYGGIPVRSMPPYKVAYWCSFSKACFFETDTLPAGAFVYNISDVVVKETGSHLPANYVVVRDSMNFFALSFDEFQQRPLHYDVTIYYHTPGSAHAYLGVRSHSDAMARIDNATLLKRYADLPDNYFDTDNEK
jgi:hypothetical protein